MSFQVDLPVLEDLLLVGT